MAKRWNGSWILACLVTMMASGCCCTQGLNTCNSCSSCPTGGCGAGPLMQLTSCRGGCGEVYVDEWFNHPPCVDDCGYSNCSCGNCRPVRSVLRALWGTPYIAPGCDSCGTCSAPGCSGCSSCDGGVVSEGHVGGSSCNCGGSHGSHVTHGPAASGPTHSPAPSPAHAKPGESIQVPAPNAPTPAPVTPSSAKRLSPVKQKMSATRASTNP